MDSIQTHSQKLRNTIRVAVASDGARFYGNVEQNDAGLFDIVVGREKHSNWVEIRVAAIMGHTLATRLMQSMLATVVRYHNKKVRHCNRRLSTIAENRVRNKTKIEDEHGDIHDAVRRAYK